MRLKYYLRGLGIGVIVATLILMIVFSGQKKELSDEEIIKRAEALGMVMSEETLPEGNNEIPDATEQTPDIEEENTEGSEPQASTEENEEIDTKELVINEDTEQELTGELQPIPENVPENTPETPASDEKISFTIAAGQTSDTIARNLYDAGLVDNAAEFNAYLVENGYDSKIRTGTFSISPNASYWDIANTLIK